MIVTFWWENSPSAEEIAGGIAAKAATWLRSGQNGKNQSLSCEMTGLDKDGHRRICHIRSALFERGVHIGGIDIDNVDIIDLTYCQASRIRTLERAIDQADREMYATAGKLIKGGEIARIRIVLKKVREQSLFRL